MRDSSTDPAHASRDTPAAKPVAVNWPDPLRGHAFRRWIEPLATPFGLELAALAPASADASFRRYLRLPARGRSLIVMDAPPAHEDVRPFVRVGALLRDAGLVVPEVLAADVGNGFLLLSDLGRCLYLDALLGCQREAGPGASADALMRPALAALVRMQQAVPAASLPPFGRAAQQAELALFPTWCVAREAALAWGAPQHAAWLQVCDALIAHNLAQPQVAVHADWMPRNLMVGAPGATPGVLDFQDAVAGPIGYDLASLLRDAFISWDEEQELDWAIQYWTQARVAGLPVDADFGSFWRAVEWTGLQRHLKVMGIFCRLKHRDGKPGYAADLPRFMAYATKVALRYRELKPLLKLLEPLSGQAVRAGFTF